MELTSDNRVSELCLKILKANQNSIFAQSLPFDLLCYGFQPSGEKRRVIEGLRNPEAESAGSNLATNVCSILEAVDPMRSNYWGWRRSNLSSQVCWGWWDPVCFVQVFRIGMKYRNGELLELCFQAILHLVFQGLSNHYELLI